jgi:(R)-2-hydroxyacyl-CoA dehydratese activating ATPase
MIYAGIDAGSRTIKIVLIDEATRKVVASGVADQGVKQAVLAAQLFDRVLKDARTGCRGVRRVVATGYGRDALTFADSAVTEITCHAHGVRCQRRDARTIVDIGGQDSKVIRLDGGGRVSEFVMNDRCAAGTGRFLEVVTERLGVRLADLGKLAGRAKKPAVISSTCVVFADTEIIGLLAAGTAPANIVAGVRKSIATRIAAMVGRNAFAPVIFTGGVALIPGMARALELAIGHPVHVARHPQLTGAMGAAILAADAG